MQVPRLASFAALALAAVAFLAVACGGGKEEAAAPTATRPPAAEATKPAATATRPAATATKPAATATRPAVTATEPAATATSAAPTTQTLEISQVPTLKFDKTELRAKAGGKITVKFTNTDSGIPHNWALYRDEGFKEAIAGANENICTGPCSGEVTFGPLDPGTYFFHCDVHPAQMKGQFIVE